MKGVIAGLVGLVFLIGPVPSQAQDRELSPFSSRCEGTAATGFNWESRAWVKSNFRPLTYLARKVDPEKAVSPEGDMAWGCIGFNKPEYANILDTTRTTVGCYTYQEFGQKTFYSWCSENFVRESKSASWKLTSIRCEAPWVTFAFKPNGQFTRSSAAGNLSTDADYKDSMVIEVGDCVVVG